VILKLPKVYGDVEEERVYIGPEGRLGLIE
jgi:hypothetical protein